MTIQFLLRALASTRILAVVLLLAVAFVSGPASADVQLRVAGRPISNPIQAFVRVSDPPNGAVAGLNETNFEVMLDGALITLQSADVTRPPDEDSGQKVSVVFVMDYTSSVTICCRPDMESSVIAFIDAMNVGDYAAIIKFNNDTGASVVQAFVEIDQGVNNDALEDAVMLDYDGDGSNILDATNVAVEHFATQLAMLPAAGPKAIILVTDGIDSHSTSTSGEVIGAANDSGIPIFTIGVGNPTPNAENLLTSLATDTGGEFIPAPTGPAIAAAYVSVSELLNGAYLLTIPLLISDPIIGDDCNVHTMDVTVAPHGSASVAFTRRICDTVPEAFSFTNQTGIATGRAVTSNIVPITGIEIPAAISIVIGTYSIDCNGTFTNNPGTISNDETVCVRHTTSSAPSTSRTTTLTIGGVSGTFTSTTSAASGGGGGGGGGATGGVELLLGLVALMARRRRRV